MGFRVARGRRSRSGVILRQDVDGKGFTRLLCGRLDELAKQNEGSEFADLASRTSRLFNYNARDTSETGEKESKTSRQMYDTFRQAYVDNSLQGLDSQIKYTLRGQLVNARFTSTNIEDQSKLADLRYPVEWYPGTRVIQRTIHLHVGPTNSGKTYQALQRLEQAKTGVYAGPLRLLAYEVYTRLNAKGKNCHLITGDDRRINEDSEDSMVSCTVEMVPTDHIVDVAVVDEIQMIGNEDRGWAWSQALLGLKAKELHLCGEARTVPLIRELAAQMGDKLEIHHYERLSPLKAASRSLNGDLNQLRKGDCIVVFSRKEIHALKTEIEKKTTKRVAIVYGSLPPETRARQARLFNDPNNDYDYLVASDAIGMGLNLDIKRIIFESTWKFNGMNWEAIPVAHLKQIAGRAGRYRIAPQTSASSESQQNIGDGMPPAAMPNRRSEGGTVGLVTSLEQMDYARVRQAMETEAEPIMTAGIFPPTKVLVRFAAYFPPETPFSYIISRLHEISSLHPRYHLCRLKDQIHIADTIEVVRGLTVADRIIFCASPAAARLSGMKDVTVAFAECVANNTGGGLLDIKQLNLEILERPVTMDRDYLHLLETLHKALILYIWLSYRFVGVFNGQEMAFYVKGLVEERIDKGLAEVSSTRKRKMKALRQLAMLEDLGLAYGDKTDPGVKKDKPTFKQIALGSAEGEDVEDIGEWEGELIPEQEDSNSNQKARISEHQDLGPLWKSMPMGTPKEEVSQEAATA